MNFATAAVMGASLGVVTVLAVVVAVLLSAYISDCREMARRRKIVARGKVSE